MAITDFEARTAKPREKNTSSLMVLGYMISSNQADPNAGMLNIAMKAKRAELYAVHIP
jgi:hypothetical protein